MLRSQQRIHAHELISMLNKYNLTAWMWESEERSEEQQQQKVEKKKRASVGIAKAHTYILCEFTTDLRYDDCVRRLQFGHICLSFYDFMNFFLWQTEDVCVVLIVFFCTNAIESKWKFDFFLQISEWRLHISANENHCRYLEMLLF